VEGVGIKMELFSSDAIKKIREGKDKELLDKVSKIEDNCKSISAGVYKSVQKMNKDIMIVGDIHGDFNELNTIINRKNPKIILQCGDFGVWPHYHMRKDFNGTGKPWDYYGIKNPNTEIYFCDGNHENFEYLDKLVDVNGRKNPIELPGFKNVFYMPRTSTLQLPDGKNVMFIGGALSIDKDNRIIGDSWWPTEEINRRDMEYLPDMRIDIVISHTLPQQCLKYLGMGFSDYRIAKFNDNSCRWLDIILGEYRPKKWYCGHFHLYKKFMHKDCEFTVLSIPDHYNTWWEWL
jgi:hypothetical protein